MAKRWYCPSPGMRGRRGGIVDEIAGLAERIADLTAQLIRLEALAQMGFAVMEMAYARGFDDGLSRRPLRKLARSPRAGQQDHLRPVP
jgi:hypothetical protein